VELHRSTPGVLDGGTARGRHVAGLLNRNRGAASGLRTLTWNRMGLSVTHGSSVPRRNVLLADEGLRARLWSRLVLQRHALVLKLDSSTATSSAAFAPIVC
jgi:hypothetical protein